MSVGKIAFNASLIGVFARFVGFCSSIAINNELQLFTKSTVREKVREAVNEINPQLPLALQNIQNTYQNAGNDVYTLNGASTVYLNKLIKELARATRDYYDFMPAGIIVVIVILIFSPKIENVVLKLTRGNVPY